MDCEVFYAPEHANFILAADIHKAAAMKGSDASNMHDEEPRVDVSHPNSRTVMTCCRGLLSCLRWF